MKCPGGSSEMRRCSETIARALEIVVFAERLIHGITGGEPSRGTWGSFDWAPVGA